MVGEQEVYLHRERLEAAKNELLHDMHDGADQVAHQCGQVIAHAEECLSQIPFLKQIIVDYSNRIQNIHHEIHMSYAEEWLLGITSFADSVVAITAHAASSEIKAHH